MALAISEQYRRFVEFAQTYVNQGNEDAIARDGGAAAAPLAGRTITIANDNDHIKQWLRPGDQRNLAARGQAAQINAVPNAKARQKCRAFFFFVCFSTITNWMAHIH